MAPIHVSSSEVILLDDSDDEELLVMNIADVTSLDDLDFSNDGPGNKKTCAVDNTSSQDAAVDVDNYSTKSNGLAFLDHDGHRCEVLVFSFHITTYVGYLFQKKTTYVGYTYV